MKIIITHALVWLFYLLPNFSYAQSPGTSDQINSRWSRIDHVIQEYVDKEWINGAEALVYQNDQIVYHKSFGYRDLTNKTPLEKNAIYRMASQTKLITAIGVMMLFEQGKFLLDDPISRYLPEFKNLRVMDSFNPKDSSFTASPAASEITIKQLLTHTSGIGYPQIGTPTMTAIYHKMGIYGGLGLTNEASVKDQMMLLAKAPLFNQPGEKFTYGLNSDLLGYFIEVVSGQSLWEFFRKEIFLPLEMEDTWFFLPKYKSDRLVPLHLENANRKVEKSPKYFDIGGKTLSDYPKENGSYFSGGAGLSSTAMDYTKILRMILNDGEFNGTKFLSKSTLRLMTTNQLGDLEFTMDDKGNKFGLGLILVSEESGKYNLMTPGSLEGGGAFSTWFWIDPEKEIVGQLMMNKFPNSHFDLVRKIQNMVYQALD